MNCLVPYALPQPHQPHHTRWCPAPPPHSATTSHSPLYPPYHYTPTPSHGPHTSQATPNQALHKFPGLLSTASCQLLGLDEDRAFPEVQEGHQKQKICGTRAPSHLAWKDTQFYSL
jgi:hypothetical protein